MIVICKKRANTGRGGWCKTHRIHLALLWLHDTQNARRAMPASQPASQTVGRILWYFAIGAPRRRPTELCTGRSEALFIFNQLNYMNNLWGCCGEKGNGWWRNDNGLERHRLLTRDYCVGIVPNHYNPYCDWDWLVKRFTHRKRSLCFHFPVPPSSVRLSRNVAFLIWGCGHIWRGREEGGYCCGGILSALFGYQFVWIVNLLSVNFG